MRTARQAIGRHLGRRRAGPTGHRSARHDRPCRPRRGRRRQRGHEVGAGSLHRARAGTRPRRERQRPVSGGAAGGLLAHTLHGRPLRVSGGGGVDPPHRPASGGVPRQPPGFEQAAPEGGVRALLSTESVPRPLCVHWILVRTIERGSPPWSGGPRPHVSAGRNDPAATRGGGAGGTRTHGRRIMSPLL